MADLGVNVRPGVVVAVGSALAVNVDGAVYGSPWWPASYIPTAGDPVRVLLCNGESTVLGPTIPGQRSATGTVAGVPSAGLLPVTIGSTTVQCRYAGTAPASGSLVLLSWESTIPWVINTATAYTPTTTITAPPPSAPPSSSSGTLSPVALDSGSWRSVDGWGSSRQAVMQYTFTGSNPYSGAWFYGSQAGQLSGATISRVQIHLPARLNIGSYSAAEVAHFYAHTSGSRPSGDVIRTAGPSDVTIPGNYGGGWIDLPVAWASTLVAGGGIGILGSPYLGFNGVDADPSSGQLALTWSR